MIARHAMIKDQDSSDGAGRSSGPQAAGLAPDLVQRSRRVTPA